MTRNTRKEIGATLQRFGRRFVSGRRSGELRVIFDERVKEGSVEHFWHFMFGYLLPLLSWLLSSSHVLKSSLYLTVQDCGPVMNRLVEEALGLLDVKYGVADECILTQANRAELPQKIYDDAEFLHAKSWEEGVLLPRWDLLFCNRPEYSEQPTASQRLALLQTFRQLLSKLQPFLLTEGHNDEVPIDGHYLILERSEQPAFYDKNGTAAVKGYGKGRRSLANLAEAEQVLQAEGLSACRYEPGAHSLADQVRNFSSCNGIIGQRGAEFASLFWMKPGALAVLIDASEYSKPPPPARLARLMNIDYRQLEDAGTAADVQLMPIRDVKEIVRQHHESR